MFEIIALMNPVQLNDSSVIEAIDTPGWKLTDENIRAGGDGTRQERSIFYNFTDHNRG